MTSANSPESFDALVKVTADSLALHSGLVGEDVRPENVRLEKLDRQLGILQRQSAQQQHKIYNEFAANYLPSLMKAYRENSGPVNTSTLMFGAISHTAYFVRFQRTEAAKDLTAIHAHRTAIDTSISHDAEKVGEATQFLSTLLLLQGISSVSEEDRKTILLKLKEWKREFRGTDTVAENASERCHALLTSKSGLPDGFDIVKSHLEKSIEKCGLDSCTRRKQASGTELMQCGRCKTALYVSLLFLFGEVPDASGTQRNSQKRTY